MKTFFWCCLLKIHFASGISQIKPSKAHCQPSSDVTAMHLRAEYTKFVCACLCVCMCSCVCACVRVVAGRKRMSLVNWVSGQRPLLKQTWECEAAAELINEKETECKAIPPQPMKYSSTDNELLFRIKNERG